MNSIEKLIEIFSHFPGIGPRQARRFVYYLLTRNQSALEDLTYNISQLKNTVVRCNECGRFFERKYENGNICSICSDQNRDHSTLMLVPRDSDLEAVERKGVFNGVYFVLGGTVPILEKEPEKKIRIKELKEKMGKSKDSTKEIILAMNWNPEGENTAEYVENLLKVFNIKISHLGKGLSMGTELEYADGETIKNALKNRQ